MTGRRTDTPDEVEQERLRETLRAAVDGEQQVARTGAQARVAARVGVSASTLSKFLAGERWVSGQTAASIVDALGPRPDAETQSALRVLAGQSLGVETAAKVRAALGQASRRADSEGDIIRAIEALDSEARARVIAYVNDRWTKEGA